ncbi:MAG: hypothetical protein JNL73_08395 [Anaerolineales bacterium]|nr:hypothetical protein [Anaerolineales bacterium]
MDLEVLKRLRAPEGQALLAQAAALAPTELTRLACIEALRRQADPVLARAALETVLLRARAKTKFARAEHMFFEREALEQASGERVSRYRAARYHGAAAVADLCAGLGGDAIGLAGVAPVIVVDRDPLRLALVEANLAAYEAQADTRSLDLEANDPPDTTALWCDPGRRAGGRRTFTVAAYQPPLERVVGWQARTPALGVKLSPGVDLDELRGYAAEREFISVDGELKECVLWFGPLATTGWRATALRSGAGPVHTLAGDLHDTQSSPAGLAPVGEVGSVLYEPDPAVIRAGQVRALAGQLGARQFDESIAYLTADIVSATPLARAFEIDAVLPFQLKRLRQYLVAQGIGRVVVKKRGSAITPEELQRGLRLNGEGREAVVFLTRRAGEPLALVGRPLPG